MLDDNSFKDIIPKSRSAQYSSPEVISGIPVPATQRIKLFSPDEWEEFTLEWTYSLQEKYHKVQRIGGAGDMGCDVVGFKTQRKMRGPWVNYQCKHYGGPLAPSQVWVEFGKILYYSFIGEYPPPDAYYFVAPHGVGTKLSHMLNDSTKLRSGLIENWDKYCLKGITDTKTIPLEGPLKEYLDDFDFSIFDEISTADLIEGHSKTPFHATRFGGGLAQRPPTPAPPLDVAENESRYIQQLFGAYSDAKKIPISSVVELDKWPHIQQHFQRSREQFYHAESLRNFARDNVPPGTFESLQDEIYHGVIDICESNHKHGLERVRQTISKAGDIALTSNALCGRTEVRDRQGVCHQLANEDRLIWVDRDDS